MVLDFQEILRALWLVYDSPQSLVYILCARNIYPNAYFGENGSGISETNKKVRLIASPSRFLLFGAALIYSVLLGFGNTFSSLFALRISPLKLISPGSYHHSNTYFTDLKIG